MIRGSVGIDGATCWRAGAMRILQKEVEESEGTVVDCTERERHFGVILEELENAQEGMCKLKGFLVERMERERRDIAGCDAVRVLHREMCELKEQLKNKHEDKTKVIQLIPRHRTTECAVEQVVDVPAPVAHEDKVEMTRLDVLVPQNHSSERIVGECVGVRFVPLREDKVEESELSPSHRSTRTWLRRSSSLSKSIFPIASWTASWTGLTRRKQPREGPSTSLSLNQGDRMKVRCLVGRSHEKRRKRWWRQTPTGKMA